MSKSREQINQFLSTIDITGKTVLDVGVQDNPAYKYCRGTAFEYHTLDIDPSWNPNFIEDINQIGNYEYQLQYEIVFALEVLEHIWNPIQALRRLYEFTRDGGVCYISVPFINPIHDKWDYLRYTPEWFEKVLPMVGFKDFKIHNRMATIGQCDLSHFYNSEGLRMSKVRKEMGDGGLINLIGLFIEAKK